MRFEPLGVAGAALVRIEPHPDPRGFFARTFCAREFAAAGLAAAAVQSSVSYNERAGTVRGMHFQWPPSQEAKLVRCIRGRLHDVLLDLRPQSPSYLRHVAVGLDQDNRDAVFIPHGIAHGFQTLSDRTEVLYQMSDYFVPDIWTRIPLERPGLRHRLADAGQLDFRAGRQLRRLRPAAVRGGAHAASAGTAGMSGTAASVGEGLHAFATQLYPICRSITGGGVRETLRSDQSPHRSRSGTRSQAAATVFDWEVPPEWNIEDA